jgi:hypothetical protein
MNSKITSFFAGAAMVLTPLLTRAQDMVASAGNIAKVDAYTPARGPDNTYKVNMQPEDYTWLGPHEALKKAAKFSENHRIPAIVLYIGKDAGGTPQQVIDWIDNKVFTGENEMPFKTFFIIEDDDKAGMDVIIGGHYQGRSTYSQKTLKADASSLVKMFRSGRTGNFVQIPEFNQN